MCGLSITTSGEASEDEAYDYINAMLDPRSGAALFDEYGYGHGNARSVELIDPDRAHEAGVDDPSGTFARGIYTSALPPAKKAKLFQLWFEAKAGLD
jgi:spermidine/putrescine-binding protein